MARVPAKRDRRVTATTQWVADKRVKGEREVSRRGAETQRGDPAKRGRGKPLLAVGGLLSGGLCWGEREGKREMGEPRGAG